jgi:hypothetical protein
MLPAGAAQYLGVRPLLGGDLQNWSINPRRVSGAGPRAATMQVAIVRGGKVSPPVTIPVPFY